MTGRSAFHIRRWTLNVRCLPAFGGARGDQGSMFKLLHLKLRLNLHITLKLRIQVRSSEVGVFLVMIWMLCYPLPMNLRKMKYLPYKKLKYRFDFEIGYLTKSPCRECEKRKDFPDCMDDCNMLDKIHTILCEAISCSKRR